MTDLADMDRIRLALASDPLLTGGELAEAVGVERSGIYRAIEREGTTLKAERRTALDGHWVRRWYSAAPSIKSAGRALGGAA